MTCTETKPFRHSPSTHLEEQQQLLTILLMTQKTLVIKDHWIPLYSTQLLHFIHYMYSYTLQDLLYYSLCAVPHYAQSQATGGPQNEQSRLEYLTLGTHSHPLNKPESFAKTHSTGKLNIKRRASLYSIYCNEMNTNGVQHLPSSLNAL